MIGENLNCLLSFLNFFCDAILKFSATKNVTSKDFAIELIMIHDTIQSECDGDNNFLKPLAENMKGMFFKYRENLNNMIMLLFVAIVWILD